MSDNSCATIRKIHTLLLTILIICVETITGKLYCGGFQYGVQGLESVSRAGANVAGTEGAEAFYLNVAGIARAEHPEVVIGSNFVNLSAYADLLNDGNGTSSWRLDDEREFDYLPVRNSREIYFDGFKFFPAIYLGIVFPIPKLKKLTIGFGIFGPAALGDYQYPETVKIDEATDENGKKIPLPSPQRYDIISEKVLFVWPTIAFGYKITEQLRAGIGFQWGFIHLKFRQTINNSAVTTPDAFVNDTIAEIDARDLFVPAFIFGIQWRACSFIEMGWSIRVSDGISAKGKVVSTINPYGDDPIRSDDKSLGWMDEQPYKRPTGRLSFNWPHLVYRSGLRYFYTRKNPSPPLIRAFGKNARELFDIEVGFFLEQNHVLENMVMKVDGYFPYGRNEGEAIPFRPDKDGIIHIRRNWRDVFSVRVGGNLNLLKGYLSIGAGGFYESPTIEDEDTRLDYPGNSRWGLSAGLMGRYSFKKLPSSGVLIEGGISYMHIFYPEVNVKEGNIRHISYMTPSGIGTVINGGKYKFSMDVITAGLRLTFI